MQKLILLPNILHEESTWRYDPPPIHALIAESHKGGYQFLKRFYGASYPIYLLNEHTRDPHELLNIKEEVVGLVSDAGLPCLADPGAFVVRAAHQAGIQVETIPGPSSIIMALQLSGFSGQTFTFHGYFPREPQELRKLLRELGSQTHIFIETPYKTFKVFDFLIQHLPSQAQLCIAAELMGPHPYVRTDSIAGWKQKGLPFQKGRAVYLLSIGAQQ